MHTINGITYSSHFTDPNYIKFREIQYDVFTKHNYMTKGARVNQGGLLSKEGEPIFI